MSYKKGDWKAICDVCGWDYYASQLLLRWDGARVCKKDWEPRHPQDFLKTQPDNQSVPWTRVEPSDVFIEVDYVAEDVGSQEITIPDGTFGDYL